MSIYLGEKRLFPYNEEGACADNLFSYVNQGCTMYFMVDGTAYPINIGEELVVNKCFRYIDISCWQRYIILNGKLFSVDDATLGADGLSQVGTSDKWTRVYGFSDNSTYALGICDSKLHVIYNNESTIVNDTIEFASVFSVVSRNNGSRVGFAISKSNELYRLYANGSSIPTLAKWGGSQVDWLNCSIKGWLEGDRSWRPSVLLPDGKYFTIDDDCRVTYTSGTYKCISSGKNAGGGPCYAVDSNGDFRKLSSYDYSDIVLSGKDFIKVTGGFENPGFGLTSSGDLYIIKTSDSDCALLSSLNVENMPEGAWSDISDSYSAHGYSDIKNHSAYGMCEGNLYAINMDVQRGWPARVTYKFELLDEIKNVQVLYSSNATTPDAVNNPCVILCK